MFRVARLIDEFDDMLGIVRAASSIAYIVIVFLSIVLLISATLSLGLSGLMMSILIGGAAISAATFSSSRD